MGALVPLRLTMIPARRRGPRFSDISLHDFILRAFNGFVYIMALLMQRQPND